MSENKTDKGWAKRMSPQQGAHKPNSFPKTGNHNIPPTDAPSHAGEQSQQHNTGAGSFEHATEQSMQNSGIKHEKQDGSPNKSASSSASDAHNQTATADQRKILELTAKIASITEELTNVTADRESWKEKFLLEAASKENMRKSLNKEMESVKRYGNSEMAKSYLSLLDDIEKLNEEIEKLVSKDNPLDVAKLQTMLLSLMEASTLILSNIRNCLSRYDIIKISPLGKMFDHNYHQAIQQVPSPSAKEGEIVQVIQNGYTIGDRLLRPAMVIVASKI